MEDAATAEEANEGTLRRYAFRDGGYADSFMLARVRE
jgi:hypothetical protein